MEKLDLFGIDYIYQVAEQYEIEMSYKAYVTDCLKIIAENTAKYAGGNTIGIRFYDIINPQPDEPTKSAEEVKNDILMEFQKIGGEN